MDLCVGKKQKVLKYAVGPYETQHGLNAENANFHSKKMSKH